MLPSTLLDLLSLRLSARAKHGAVNIRLRNNLRRVQQLASQRAGRTTVDETLFPESDSNSRGDLSSLYLQQAQKQVHALSELEARVGALKEAAEESIQTTGGTHSDVLLGGPHFSEVALREIYKDLLGSPLPRDKEDGSPEIAKVSAKEVLQRLRERLPEFEAAAQGQAQTDNPEGLASRLSLRASHRQPFLQSRAPNFSLNSEIIKDLATWNGDSSLRETISRLRVVLRVCLSAWPSVEAEYATDEIRPVPFRLLSNMEWAALSEVCLHEKDPVAAEAVLELMKTIGLQPADEQSDQALNYFANKGLVAQADRFFASQGLDVPRERQRDYLIKTRIKAKQLGEALTLLHKYEAQQIPAPMKSYTRIIRELFAHVGPGSAQHAAQAWDLFAHMRYVAHPVPDALLYGIMIRASAEPERALDLFTEMTVEQGIVPDAQAYTAVIRACARSKRFALHAFRIAREMLNSHRDAEGRIPPHLRPDVHTFLGLLDAAKRIGDLSRARWVFAEMARGASDGKFWRGDDEEAVNLAYVDERALKHMFHAYAAYRPPFRRRAVPVQEAVADGAVMDREDESTGSQQAVQLGSRERRGIPQTRSEVLREASQLWERVLADRRRALSGSKGGEGLPSLIFGRVQMDASLVNTYLSVYFVHAPPSRAYAEYDAAFEHAGVQRDAFSFVIALEAYAMGHLRLPQHEKEVALGRAREVWGEWCALEEAERGRGAGKEQKVGARLVERAWRAMIRLLALTNNVTEAEQLLRQFVSLYPPASICPSAPEVEAPNAVTSKQRRSPRIQLYAEQRPLIRLMEPSGVAEDRIGPFLTFDDVAVVHQRAVGLRKWQLVGWLKWVVCAYEGALRKRREMQLKGTEVEGVKTEPE